MSWLLLNGSARAENAEQATDYKSAAAGTDVMESYLSYLFVHYFKLQTILLAYEFAYFLYFTVLVH